MRFFRRLAAILAFGAILAPLPTAAAPQDAVLNKEGYWGIDVDHGACAASMTLQGGSVFLLRAQDGQVTFALFGRAPLARGKVVRLETEAYGFDFRASYGEDGASLFYDGDLDAKALAALRLARQVRVLADGRQVAAMTFEGTGFPGALDGVVACSQGDSGWWGRGVGAQVTDTGPRPDRGADGPVFNAEGDWAIAVGEDPGVCVAQASVDEHMQIQILAGLGRLGLAVGSDADLRRGRRGKVETDGYAFDFNPGYGGRRYVSSNEPFDNAALAALHRAKWLRVSIDGRTLLDIDLTDTGFAALLDSVAACSKGEKGWWGDGAKQPG
ncbi:hypothetical protein [Phenylobacterium sp.]|jgi:hypothetical protein|uniref:hypothetical protein n=1 Tax=Phenylobacterium sp. TaxID=1871053 RepID=UPI002E325331|nr:hypothetical protein [Phenylobacterium sp.]HEX4710238.1 hypothetical protein [Phenylobacterium sp.]